MLSFSTDSSTQHERVYKVQATLELAKTKQSSLIIDGELQLDAVFVPEIGAAKAADSPVAGNANVFIFPSLEAGNLGYKIAERIGGAAIIGAILQGLANPGNDLSRGRDARDVLNVIAITIRQSN